MHPQSRHFFIFIIALVIIAVLVALFAFPAEAPAREQTQAANVLFATPSSLDYEVERSREDATSQDREVFIQKVRSSLPKSEIIPEVLTEPVEEPQTSTVPEESMVENTPVPFGVPEVAETIVPTFVDSAATPTPQVQSSTSTYGDTHI